MHRVTAAVVLFNGTKLIPGLASSIRKLSGIEVVMYDSGSTDGSAETAKNAIPGASVLSGLNRGFGYGNNRCIEQVETEYTLFLNSDADIDADSLAELVKFLDSNREYGAVQPVVRLWDWGLVTASRGVYVTDFGEGWDAGFMHLEPFIPDKRIEVPAVTAAVSLWRTDLLRSLNGFDEEYFMYFEDADLSLRAQAAGWKLAVCPTALARHMIGASSSRDIAGIWELESSVRLFRRFFGDGHLSRKWWQREIKTIARLVAGGRNPMWRLRALSKGLSGSLEPVSLPLETHAILSGEPGDRPLHRQQPGAPGPGWRNGMVSPYAGIEICDGDLVLELTGVDHTATGAVLSGTGELLTRFTAIPGETRRITMAPGPSVVYIKCDSSDSILQAGVK